MFHLTPNSIFKNTFYLMTGRATQRFLSFFITVYITRYLGPTNYGQYIYIITVISIAQIIWGFGLQTLIVKEVAGDISTAEKYIENSIIAQSFLMVLVTSLTLSLLYIYNNHLHILIPAFMFAFGLFLFSITTIFESYFKGIRRMEFSSLISVLKPFLFLILILIVAKFTSGGVVEIFSCHVASFAATLVVALLLIKKYKIILHIRPDYSFILKLLKKSAPFMLISVVSMLLFRIDHLMLFNLGGEKPLGHYASAFLLIEVIISFFPMLIMDSTFPVFSEAYQNDKNKMNELFNFILKYFILIGCATSCGSALLSSEIVTSLYGNEFIQAGEILLILGSGIWIFFLNSLFSWLITAMGRQDIVLWVNITILVLNTVLNYFLIIAYGANGAAATTVFCQVISMIAYIIFLRHRIKCHIGKDVITIIGCNAAMACLIIFLKRFFFFINTTITLFLIILLAAVVYLGFAYVMKVFNKLEFKVFLNS